MDGLVVKELRDGLSEKWSRKVTQHELGDIIGVDQKTINLWEHEKGRPGRLARRAINQIIKKEGIVLKD